MDSQPTVQERGREGGRKRGERKEKKKMSGTKVYVVIRKQNKGVPESHWSRFYDISSLRRLSTTGLHMFTHIHMSTYPGVTHNLVLINLRQPEDFYSLLVV